MIEERTLEKRIPEIGALILQKERECLLHLGRGLNEDNYDPRYPEQYYNQVGHNLWAGHMKDGSLVQYPHFEEYGGASGGELKDTRTPAKMKSIRSSSAMTYNLLGNHQIELIGRSERLSKGLYKVEYEKQLYTLRDNPQPANLDAYLYCEETSEAIFCEMKMMEWILNPPMGIKDAYMDPKNHFGFEEDNDNTRHVPFIDMIRMLKEKMPTYVETIGYEPLLVDGKPVLNRNGRPRNVGIKGEVHHFFRYDAWQMYKHALGIYNMTSEKTMCEVKRKLETSVKSEDRPMKQLPALKKVTLVNVVFEPSQDIFVGELSDYYKDLLTKEHEDFECFKRCLHESGVIEAFRSDCGIDFDVCYMSVKEFMKCFEVGDRRAYLNRYCLESV